MFRKQNHKIFRKTKQNTYIHTTTIASTTITTTTTAIITMCIRVRTIHLSDLFLARTIFNEKLLDRP